MLKETLKKFGYPGWLVKDYENWLLLCRFRQVTLGSLILICKDEVDAFSKISEKSFAEFPEIVREIEKNLKELFGNDKINYLMLMMADPDVHFHIIPRYSRTREFEGVIFKDKGWPDAPALKEINKVSDGVMHKLTRKLRESFGPQL